MLPKAETKCNRVGHGDMGTNGCFWRALETRDMQ